MVSRDVKFDEEVRSSSSRGSPSKIKESEEVVPKSNPLSENQPWMK
jgi:hypothetical protein